MNWFTKSLILFGSIFIFAIVGYIGYIGLQINGAWKNIYDERASEYDPISEMNVVRNSSTNQDISSKDSTPGSPVISNTDTLRPFTIAVLGLDTANVSYGRTDAIVLCFVDPNTKKVTTLSIPRDTRAYIPYTNSYDKINAAYAYGGISASIESIERYLDIPVDYYVVLDFNGARQFINAIGGLHVDVEKNMSFHDRITKQQIYFTKGPQHLNGMETLNYVRFRSDSEGDFGRTRRQRQVIKAVLDQTTDIRNATKITPIIGVLENNMKTNISLKNMITLATNLSTINGNDIDSLNFKGYPTSFDGISYVSTNDQDLKQLQQDIKTILYLDK